MPRPTCTDCLRPLSDCYCDHLVSIDNRIEVLIIQHPSETDHPYNTGRMANLSLSRCELVVHELIPSTLKQRLQDMKSVLLFPELDWLAEARPRSGTVQQLVVIDASWNKAKRILHTNAWLQELPRLSLNNPETSRYGAIRKSRLDASLSTIEAVAAGLQQLDLATDYSILHRPLNRLIALVQRHQRN